MKVTASDQSRCGVNAHSLPLQVESEHAHRDPVHP
jgi:hypothetical protein